MATGMPSLETIKSYFRSFYYTSKKVAEPILRLSPFSESITIPREDMEMLRNKLGRIRATLQEADRFAISDESVKLWLRELRNLEYCAEDVLEEIQYQSLRSIKLKELKNDSDYQKRKHDQGVLFFPSPKCCKTKIEKFGKMFDHLHFDRKALRLREGEGVVRIEPDQMIPSSSLIKCQIHGRKRDEEKVIDLLLSIEPRHGSVCSIIPIVGMAGIGKTTLVEHIYNHEAASTFKTKIWVWASGHFDVLGVTRKLGKAILKIPCDSLEYDLLQTKIKEQLTGKRFLLVLDDMWVEVQNHWESFVAPLNSGAEGSRIIVTTRSLKVAEMMGCKVYQLGCLSDESCWDVCREQIFGENKPMDCDQLIAIGRRIASRCRGSPLAAKAVGAVLRGTICQERWNDVYENCLWSDDQLVKQIMPALQVSYDYLPVPLKRCFMYCSLFPRGHLFQKDKIVQLWRAQGFMDLHESSTAFSLEYVGGKYFSELVERCFLQHAPSHESSEEIYVIHDLYHELARYMAGCEINKIDDHKLCNINEHVRHLSLVPQKHHAARAIELSPIANHGLRTLLFIGEECNPSGAPFHVQISPTMFDSLMSLRALDLSNTDITSLPHSIANMIHLRYLCLERTGIESLPEEISGLFNLQCINLKQCSQLHMVSCEIKLLENLRCLELPVNRGSDLVVPSGIHMLTNLQRLPVFVVGSGTNGCQIEELDSLVNLRGELHIFGLQNVFQAQSADRSNLRKKEKLQKLSLEWSPLEHPPHVSLNREDCSRILQNLQPHSNLKELIIKGFCGTCFPTWLGNQYLAELVVLDLMDCEECQQLPSLGQLPSLRHLTMQSIGKVQAVGHEFVGNTTGFLKLESLRFRKMDAWEMWDGIGKEDFPSLRYLILTKCSKLRKLPSLIAMQNLKIWYCEQLHELPVLPSLKSLKLGGFEELRLMPQIMNFDVLEILEISCCRKLCSLGNLQQFLSLRYLNISKCPLLDVMDLDMFPPQLENFSFEGSSPLLGQLLSSDQFESTLTDVQVGFPEYELLDTIQSPIINFLRTTRKHLFWICIIW